MNNKIALLIIYNHRYDKNISRLNEIYANRFTYIYHIVPFYDGELDNVIPVYDNSFQFQGYISQAYQHIKDKGFTHYVIVADDMMINPILNETNFFERTGIGEDYCFIHELKDYETIHKTWWHLKDLIQFSVFYRGVEIKNILPSVEQAEKALSARGLKTRLIPEWPFNKFRYSVKELALRKRRIIRWYIFRKLYYNYPLVAGYSDMIVVPAGIMPRFCQYCGAFAASRLFVEIAIPTSMVLCTNKIQTIEQTNYPDSLRIPRDKDRNFLPQYNYSYNELEDNFPKDMFYIHPIKLSKWK